MGISTHILDTSLGRPAPGVVISLSRLDGDVFVERGRFETDADGRVKDLLAGDTLQAGVHRLRFEVAKYFAEDERPCFYPFVEIVFEVSAPDEHHHVPLLLNPFGYSTYRGS